MKRFHSFLNANTNFDHLKGKLIKKKKMVFPG